MSDENRRFLHTVLLVCTLSGAAAFGRNYVRSFPDVGFTDKFVNFARTFYYLGLFGYWGISCERRVASRRVRRFLCASAALLVLWLAVREFKWRFAFDPDLLRHLWYAYYIPILAVPFLALLISYSVREYEEKPLPRWTAAAGGFTGVLVLLALTNDAHQLVFRFPQDFRGLWSENDYTHGPLYYLIIGWMTLCAVLAVARMLKRSRPPREAKQIALPALPIAIAFLYNVFYLANLPPVRPYFSDTAVFYGLVFLAFFECCIRTGLIRTNAAYASLLQGERLVWAGDVTDFFETQEKLEDLREELQDRRELLEYEYGREKELRTLAEQNRLYDLLQEKTQRQLSEIDALAEQYGKTLPEEEKSSILARIVLLGTYIKRRRNFVLSLPKGSEGSSDLLRSALDESARALGLRGVRMTSLVPDGAMAASQMEDAYDFFENAAEVLPKEARFFSVRVSRSDPDRSEAVRVSILADAAWEDAASLKARWDGLRIEAEEDETQLLLPLPAQEGGLS